MNKKNVRALERLLDPVRSALNDEASRQLIGIKADAKAQARIRKLARRCNEGQLTLAERAEYEAFVLAGDLIAIPQARLRLTRHRQPA